MIPSRPKFKIFYLKKNPTRRRSFFLFIISSTARPLSTLHPHPHRCLGDEVMKDGQTSPRWCDTHGSCRDDRLTPRPRRGCMSHPLGQTHVPQDAPKAGEETERASVISTMSSEDLVTYVCIARSRTWPRRTRQDGSFRCAKAEHVLAWVEPPAARREHRSLCAVAQARRGQAGAATEHRECGTRNERVG